MAPQYTTPSTAHVSFTASYPPKHCLEDEETVSEDHFVGLDLFTFKGKGHISEIDLSRSIPAVFAIKS